MCVKIEEDKHERKEESKIIIPLIMEEYKDEWKI